MNSTTVPSVKPYLSKYAAYTFKQLAEENPLALECPTCKIAYFLEDLKAINWVGEKIFRTPRNFLDLMVFSFKCMKCKQWAFIFRHDLTSLEQSTEIMSLINARLKKVPLLGMTSEVKMAIYTALDEFEDKHL